MGRRGLACGIVLALVLALPAGRAWAEPPPGCRWIGKTVAAVKSGVARWQQRRQVARTLRAIDPLLVKAFKAQRLAHAPYSHVQVGAAVKVRRGGLLGRLPWLGQRTIKGFNSESDGDLQLCAERAAIAGLPRGAAKQLPVTKVAVVGSQRAPMPCGRCLQVISEVGTPETQVVTANLRGEHRSYRLRELLPTSFDPAPAQALTPHRPLIARAVRAYRASLQRESGRYRPTFGAAVQTDLGDVHLGMVIKNTASTFTPATQLPLDQVSRQNALRGGRQALVQAVVIAGVGSGGGLPVPTADERQHLVDMNPKATVVLYNPRTRAGAVLTAQELLPHAYERKR